MEGNVESGDIFTFIVVEEENIWLMSRGFWLRMKLFFNPTIYLLNALWR